MIGTVMMAGALLVSGTQSQLVATGGQFATSARWANPSAVTYDPAKVPVGSRVLVVERAVTEHGPDGSLQSTSTHVTLHVRGLLPNRVYGAHVHTQPCGDRPEDAGPHYQNVPDPRQPSTNPRYANPRNEVWLDIATDSTGEGRSDVAVDWRFRRGEARSVVLHEHTTGTAKGLAGTAGPRLACLTVRFV